MYSKSLELAGLALVALAVAMLLGTAAGLLAGGLALLFLGGLTDDAAVGRAVRQGSGWMRYWWFNRLLKEQLAAEGRPPSPHPPIHIDPEAQNLADRLAKARAERAKLGDRSPALRRYEPDDELERLA